MAGCLVCGNSVAEKWSEASGAAEMLHMAAGNSKYLLSEKMLNKESDLRRDRGYLKL
jgi:hypothetical protein